MNISLAVKQYDNIQLSNFITIFSHYQSDEWSCWLDSGNVDNSKYEETAIKEPPKSSNENSSTSNFKEVQYPDKNRRFHILVHSPKLTFEFKNGHYSLEGLWLYNPPDDEIKVHIENANSQMSLLDCPFDMLNILHSLFKKLVDIHHFQNVPHPFIAGALGSFGYDLNTFLNNIKNEDKKEFDLSDVCIGFYANSIIFDAHLNQLFVYYEQDNDCYIEHIEKMLLSKITQCEFKLLESWKANMNKEFYERQIHKIHEYLIAGDCYQVNFAQRFSAQYTGDVFEAYLQLREVNNAPFSSFMRYKKSAILSLSPERFMSVKNKQVETKPIKGTRKRSNDPLADKLLSEQLLNSEKDRAENLMIVDLLRNDLSKYCEPHSVKVPDLFKLESYPAVHHLVSTVKGKLRQKATPYDLLKGAFPGGSITGAPKIRAMQIIQELEPNKRSIYCGSVGYIGLRDDMDTNICIRTLLAERDQLHCWAGGGIVFDSSPSDEYQESLDKVNKILPVLENRET